MTLNGQVVGTIGAQALATACGVPQEQALGTWDVYVYMRVCIYVM
jgi:hypothetical protein